MRPLARRPRQGHLVLEQARSKTGDRRCCPMRRSELPSCRSGTSLTKNSASAFPCVCGAVSAGIGGVGGVVTGSVVRRYAALFEQFTTVPMSDLTPPGKWDKTVMRAHSWQQGALHFTFLVDPPSPRIEWDNFQVARGVLWLRTMCSSADAGLSVVVLVPRRTCLCLSSLAFVIVPAPRTCCRHTQTSRRPLRSAFSGVWVTAWQVSHTGPCLGLRPNDVAAGMHGHCRSSASVLTR